MIRGEDQEALAGKPKRLTLYKRAKRRVKKALIPRKFRPSADPVSLAAAEAYHTTQKHLKTPVRPTDGFTFILNHLLCVASTAGRCTRWQHPCSTQRCRAYKPEAPPCPYSPRLTLLSVSVLVLALYEPGSLYS